MKKLYEAMFIVDSSKAKDDYEKAEAVCLETITRHGGEIVKSIKWDDRRLCYEIEKCRRGTYILVHFEAEGPVVAKVERQCQLNENILRVLITVDTDGVETVTGDVRARGVGEEGEVARVGNAEAD